MNIHLAGGAGIKSRAERFARLMNCRLLTFYNFWEETNKIWDRCLFYELNLIKEMKKVNLFLDSGAYSAKTQGVSIDINEYMDFVKENEEYITLYANLDDIDSAARSFKNYNTMLKAGLNPMPVYHYGEDEKWLLKYLDMGVEYIALGGLVGGSNLQIKQWLDRVFHKHLCKSNGLPKLKIHGFGLTSLDLMLRYPWYSVDSTSWVVTGRMGSIFLPKTTNLKWDYHIQPWKIAVSDKSPSSKEAGQHYKTITKGLRERLDLYLDEKGYRLGKSEYHTEAQSYELKDNEKWGEKKPKSTKTQRLVEVIVEPGISNAYQLRDEMNILYFLDLEKSMPEWPWAFKDGQNSLFT